MPEGELVSDDAWYHPRMQDEYEEVSISTFIPCKKSTAPRIDFELGMNLVHKYGKSGNEAVVYKGSNTDGLVHMIFRKDESKSWFMIVTYAS